MPKHIQSYTYQNWVIPKLGFGTYLLGLDFTPVQARVQEMNGSMCTLCKHNTKKIS